VDERVWPVVGSTPAARRAMRALGWSAPRFAECALGPRTEASAGQLCLWGGLAGTWLLVRCKQSPKFCASADRQIPLPRSCHDHARDPCGDVVSTHVAAHVINIKNPTRGPARYGICTKQPVRRTVTRTAWRKPVAYRVDTITYSTRSRNLEHAVDARRRTSPRPACAHARRPRADERAHGARETWAHEHVCPVTVTRSTPGLFQPALSAVSGAVR
jgi:hypothetical protein